MKILNFILNITFLFSNLENSNISLAYILPSSQISSPFKDYLGKDERYNEINQSNEDEIYKIQLNFYKSNLVKTLEDDRINRSEKILLIKDASLILDELEIFNDEFKKYNIYNAGLLLDWDFNLIE